MITGLKRIWRRTGRFIVGVVVVSILVTACQVERVFHSFITVLAPWSLLIAELMARAAGLAVVEMLAVAVVMFVGPLAWELLALTRGPRARRNEALAAAAQLSDHDRERPMLSEDEQECACHARRSYENPGSGGLRYAERFWLEGGVFGLVDVSESDVIRVVFRGTSEVGNWFLTNAQAHMVRAGAVFPNAMPGPGDKAGVHQGFAKAFEDLWLEQSRTDYPEVVNYKRSRWLWPVIYAVVLSPIALWPSLWPAWRPAILNGLERWEFSLLLTGLLFALLWAVQTFFAYGRFESQFSRKKPLKVGPALSTLLPRSASTGPQGTDKRIVFTGHSLGGALATLAFAHFCSRKESRHRPAELVTFGAPRPGEDQFLEWLQTLVRERPATRMALFADRGDPVPYLPPSPGFISSASRHPTWLSALLSGVYIVGWLPYAAAYKASFRTRWTDLLTRSGDDGLDLARHSVYHSDVCQSEIHARGRANGPGTLAQSGNGLSSPEDGGAGAAPGAIRKR